MTDCQHVQVTWKYRFGLYLSYWTVMKRDGKEKIFFPGQPRILHPLVAKEKAYYPWENNMAYLNCKGIELKTSTHMLLAGEDKDMMKIRKEGKKIAVFHSQKESCFPSLV